jgi:hypothetical protein
LYITVRVDEFLTLSENEAMFRKLNQSSPSLAKVKRYSIRFIKKKYSHH